MQEVNVRVAVRVRPLLPKERLSGEQVCVKLLPSTGQLVLGKDRAFTFDHILSSKSSQDDVYTRCVMPLVNSCFEGYNATVFAYGQTGSGKTFTVGGGNINSQMDEEFGIIPRAIRNMFEIMQKQPERDYTVKVSYVEIFKEELRDLLDPDKSHHDLHIREDDKGNTMMVGTSEVECQCLEQVMECLEQGSSYRHTGSTQMNEHSSRSHSIFTLFIEQRWADGEDVQITRSRKRSDDSEVNLDDMPEVEHYMCANFHFVDLAGSERAHRTGNVGDRFKESVHINSGLLALGNVISALGDVKKKVKTTHIPYRDSKITRILKDSLGGNAKTLMICCVSPAASSFDESLNALKYANRARNIKNKPIVNRDPQSIRFEEMQTEIRVLREELQRQRTTLVTATTDSDIRNAAHEADQLKHLDDKVIKLQTECSHYRMVAEEAWKQLTDIQQRDILSQSQNGKLSDWLELMEEVIFIHYKSRIGTAIRGLEWTKMTMIKNKVPSTLNREAWENQTIVRLESELKQCKNDLSSDEEIFAEKAREVNTMQDRFSAMEDEMNRLLQQVQDAEEKIGHQQEQLVEKEVRIDDLQVKLKDAEQQDLDISQSQGELDLLSEGPPTTTRRAKSVPAQMLGTRLSSKEEVAVRNIHTSPALITLERVMQSFRARSQLLASRLEDEDEVKQQLFSDGEDDEEYSEEEEEETPDRLNFERLGKDRRTYKLAKSKLPGSGQKTRILGRGDGQVNVLRGSQTDDEKMKQVSSPRLRGNRTVTKGLASEINAARHTQTSSELQRKELKQSELAVRQSTQRVRDLAINIRLKEQLIRELVKSSKDSQSMNKQYLNRITTLEQDRQTAKEELVELQKALLEVEEREQQDRQEKESLQSDFRKKMELAKTRIHSLQRKQKETERIANMTGHTDKKIQDLEEAVEKMRHQQNQLQRRLKDETDHKSKLEREVTREQQRVKELETQTEQQQKVLRIKTEEVTAMHRKLRSGSQISLPRDENSKLEDQKKWLDQQADIVLQQRQETEQLRRELERREDIVAKKEAMLAEKSELEIKRLRTSQVLTKDIHTVSTKLESVQRRLDETPRDPLATKEDVTRLQESRDKLRKQRNILDSRLAEGALLSPQEERRMIEVDEALEALDAAIEYKNEAITSRQQAIRRSALLTTSEAHVMSKLRSLTIDETRALLTRYFEKVIDLKENDQKKDVQCSELEMRLEETERIVSELESGLQRAAMDADRRLTQQQQKYEQKIQLLMRQLMENEARPRSEGEARSKGSAEDREKDKRLQQLSKELYYYKMKSREYKRQLQEALGGVNASCATSTDTTADRENGDPESRLGSPRDRPSKPSTPHVNSHNTRHSTTTYVIPNGDRVSTAGSERSTNASVAERLGPPGSAGGGGDRHANSASRDGKAAMPVRISRRDLRRLSTEEITLRKSAITVEESMPADSLDEGTNPWT